jgi:uncharacterized repeat protein (TIGR01451 family)
MDTRHPIGNPFRAIPVAIALIFNIVAGPIAPLLQSQIAALAPSRVMGYVGDASTFELDGNATTQSTHDWDQVYAGTSGANDTVFKQDVTGQGDDILTGGNTKDIYDLSSWLWKQSATTSVQDKDDIENAFAASYTSSIGHTIGVFGLDRYSIDGDATAGFWFFKDQVAKAGNGSGNGTGFTGVHTEGDILVVIDFTNGGAAGTATIYTWHNGALTLGTSGTACNGVSAQPVCAITNLVDTSSPWPYTPKSGTANVFPAAPVKNGSQGAGALYEAGIDLTALGLDSGCFSSFLAETRSSQQPTSTLSDFVLGSFSFCEPPMLQTQVSASSVSMGDSVTDLATLSGNKGAVEGTVDFYVCGPTNSAQDCTTGGTKVGGSISVANNKATSAAFTPDAAGFYCFRAEYTPAAGSKYLAVSHTNDTTECFQVLPAEIHVAKSADAASVSAGEDIGFTVTVSNAGTGTAKGVTLSDALPAGNGGHPVHWVIDGGADAAAFAISGADGSQSLSLKGQPISLAAGGSLTVHIDAATTADNCATYDNTASVSTTNDGSDEASASEQVLCPNLSISKTPDGGSVVAGSPITFTIAIHNGGAGKATNVNIDDDLPAGFAWAESPDKAECTISSGHLHCDIASLASGADFSVTVSAPTTAEDCGLVPNTASVDADNNPQHSDDGDVTVLCPDVSIQKSTSTPHVSAGEGVSFDLTVTAGGTGTSTNVTLTDTLPSGVSWNGPSGADAGACSISSGVLTCHFGTMAPGASKHVTLTGTAGTGACPSIANSASVSSDVDVDSSNNEAGPVQITVDCPDVSIQKDPHVTPISAGDVAQFDITVQNLGPGTAYDVNVSDDPLPAGVSWQEDSDFCSITGSALSCHWDSIAGGHGFQIHVWGTTDAADCGTLDNTAVVSAANELQTKLGNNHDSASIDVLCPNLSASKSADNGTVSAGQPVGFTITNGNSGAEGTGTAHDVMLNDPLPAGADLDWSIASQPAGNPCDITGSVGSETLECSFGDLAPGDSVSVDVTSNTAKADCATYTNIASVTASNHDELKPQADVTIECPGLNIAKSAADNSIVGGDTASFTIVVWNVGNGTAINAQLNDPLPAGGGSLSWSINPAYSGPGTCAINGAAGAQTLHCDFGDLAGGSSQEQPSASITVVADTTRDDCGTLPNEATASADNNDDVKGDASIDVACPLIKIEKSNDAIAPVLPGTTVNYSLIVTVTDGPASDVVVVDMLPAGLDDPTNISDGGTWDSSTRTILWDLGDLDGVKELTYQAAVSADDTNGQVLKNVAVVTSPNTQCPDAESLADECVDDSTVTVRVPALTIEKAADIDEIHFVFDAKGNLKSVTPADRMVTWTLTYTLTNGPVTNAVICDPLPAHLSFVSASDGGHIADGSGGCEAGVVEWSLGTLSASGSVTFKTTVDVDAPDGAIENVAVIFSDQTPEDEGRDHVNVTSESVQAATPTPRPSVPNTAVVLAPNGQPIQVPIELLVVLFLGSLGVLAVANVRAVRRRR